MSVISSRPLVLAISAILTGLEAAFAERLSSDFAPTLERAGLTTSEGRQADTSKVERVELRPSSALRQGLLQEKTSTEGALATARVPAVDAIKASTVIALTKNRYVADR